MSGDVTRNLRSKIGKKVVALYQYALFLAEEAVQEMQTRQATNEFWNNETKQAWLTLFGDAFSEPNVVGFFLAHHMEYGVFLELANDRQNAVLVPTIEKYALKMKLFAEELFGASA